MNNDRKFGENNLDATSLIAAILIVIQHSVNHLGIQFLVYNPGDRWWFGDGVSIFFIISGLLVFRSCENSIIKVAD